MKKKNISISDFLPSFGSFLDITNNIYCVNVDLFNRIDKAMEYIDTVLSISNYNFSEDNLIIIKNILGGELDD